MTEQNARKQTNFDVFTTKDGKYMKLGTLDSNTKCVIGPNNKIIFKYKNGSLLSTKTGITYTVDKDGKIFDKGSKVGFIKDYSSYPRSNDSSKNRKHFIIIALVCIGLFIILLSAITILSPSSIKIYHELNSIFFLILKQIAHFKNNELFS